MSIRLIARDLYLLQQRVERLEKQLSNTTLEKREELEDQLRMARAERDRMQKILNGAKEPPVYRKPR